MFPQVVEGRDLYSFLELESNGDTLLYHDRVLEVHYE